jgi:hypothetical protein
LKKEIIMKTINSSQSLPRGSAHFEAARALAFSIAQSDSDMLEPELVAWMDRSRNMASPVLEGCSGPNCWKDYAMSHGGRLEVDVEDTAFIFAETSQFDSYEHFGAGPLRNLRDAKGNEMICNSNGTDCVALDEWTSKLT